MARLHDRRSFLRLGAASLVAPALPLAGCAAEAPPPSGEELLPEGPPVTRPVLLPWTDGSVLIDAPVPELPMAYVSRGQRRIWVDREYRDRVYWMLDAHISVSTGLWRIPLPGDPPGLWIQPDDREREFEEYDIREWDADIDATAGDFRIRRGTPHRVRVELACVPVSGTELGVSAGPLWIERCHGRGEDGCREDVAPVGTGVRHADRDCSAADAPVELVTWVCGA